MQLTFENPRVPAGSLLLVVVAHAPGTDVEPPDGWLGVATDDGGTREFDAYLHQADLEDAATFVFKCTAEDELQGGLLAMTEANPAIAYEASNTADFAADATPTTPAAATQQAVNLAIAAYSAAGEIEFTAPAGYTLIDAYTSDLVSERSFGWAWKRIAAVGAAVAQPPAAADPAATGSSFLIVLRDRHPFTPREIYDPVPGNIGLRGRDTRPPREAGNPNEEEL